MYINPALPLWPPTIPWRDLHIPLYINSFCAFRPYYNSSRIVENTFCNHIHSSGNALLGNVNSLQRRPKLVHMRPTRPRYFVVRRTRRSWKPNVQNKSLFSELLGRRVSLRVTTHALRCASLQSYGFRASKSAGHLASTAFP